MFGNKKLLKEIEELTDKVNALQIKYEKLERKSNMYFYTGSYQSTGGNKPVAFPHQGTQAVPLLDIVKKLSDHCGLDIKYESARAGNVTINKKKVKPNPGEAILTTDQKVVKEGWARWNDKNS